MKPSFDNVKRKLSEVLSSLKNQLEFKFNKKITELAAVNEQREQNYRNNASAIQVSETNLITERP